MPALVSQTTTKLLEMFSIPPFLNDSSPPTSLPPSSSLPLLFLVLLLPARSFTVGPSKPAVPGRQLYPPRRRERVSRNPRREGRNPVSGRYDCATKSRHRDDQPEIDSTSWRRSDSLEEIVDENEGEISASRKSLSPLQAGGGVLAANRSDSDGNKICKIEPRTRDGSTPRLACWGERERARPSGNTKKASIRTDQRSGRRLSSTALCATANGRKYCPSHEGVGSVLRRSGRHHLRQRALSNRF